jgi:hypothetical protein
MTFLDDVQDASDDIMRNMLERSYEDTYSQPEGEIYLTLEDADSGDVIEERQWTNVITKDYSILLARLAADNLEPRHGIFALAVGTGDVGWDPLNPPPAQDIQRSLYNEIERKPFSEVVFRKDDGSQASYPTNVVDFKAQFDENEAVGHLTEMGLIGGDVVEDMNAANPVTPPHGTYDDTVDLSGKDTLVNYKTFDVVSKSASSVLTLTWRITH